MRDHWLENHDNTIRLHVFQLVWCIGKLDGKV